MAENKKKVLAKAASPKESEETVTFTTTKKRVGKQWLATEWEYVDGRRKNVKKAGVHIELNRMLEFKPLAFCTAFTGQGWVPGEMLAKVDDLRAYLTQEAEDRAKPEVIFWEDRPRSFNERALEGIISEKDDQIQKLEALFAAAAEKDPELMALRKKVMAE